MMPGKLTAKAAENAKPGASRREIPDGLVPGLYLVVQPSGARSWALRYRFAGKPRKLTLGRFFGDADGVAVLGSPVGLAGARELARSALAELAAGRDPGAARTADREAVREGRDLFPEIAQRFIERYARPKNRRWREQARILGLKPALEGPWAILDGSPAARWRRVRVQDVTRREVIDLLDAVVDRGAPTMANRTLAAVRKLFNWAVGRGLLDASPCAGVRAPGPERSRDRVLEDDELRTVWLAAGQLGFPFGPIVRLLILTGQRQQEVAGMAWEEVDLEARLWTIPRGRMKRDMAHEVPLSASAVAVLRDLPRFRGADLVFSTNGRTPPSGFSRAKVRLGDVAAGLRGPEAGALPHWVLHDLRRTLASGMARLGVALHVIEKILAHQSGSFAGVVGIYQRHGFEAEKRDALDRWAAHVEALVEGAAAGAKVLPLRRGAK